MRNIRAYLLILISIVLVGVQFVQANEQFQNNLLKMDIYKTSLGGVKVTLYTNKPYSDSVFVNKKNDNEYVILMPETLNSMTAKPALSPVSDIIKDVQIKTQPYDAQGKGYTKITVSTIKPIEVTSQVQTLNMSNYQISQKEANELITQAAKKPPHKNTINKEIPKKEIISVKKEAKQITANSGVKTFSKPINKTQPTIPVITEQAKTVKTKLPKVNLPEAKAPQAIPLATTQPKQVSQPQPPTAKTEQTSMPESPSTEASPTAVTQQTNQQAAPPAQSQNEVPAPITIPAIGKFEQYKKIIQNNIYIALGLLLALFILLLLGARRMIKNMNEHKKFFTGNLKDKPSPVKDYSENINEDMSWKEKFQTYVENTNEEPTSETQQSGISDNQELNNLFTEEVFDEAKGEQEAEMEAVKEWQTEIEPEVEAAMKETYEKSSLDEFITDQGNVEPASVEDIFADEDLIEEAYHEEEVFMRQDLLPENVEAEEEEENKLIKSEFKIDNNNGFYLVDFEDASAFVGHINDDVFVLKRFNEKINDKIHARLNEKSGTKTSYMTKIGKFRALVEVTPNNMNLLIEL